VKRGGRGRGGLPVAEAVDEGLFALVVGVVLVAAGIPHLERIVSIGLAETKGRDKEKGHTTSYMTCGMRTGCVDGQFGVPRPPPLLYATWLLWSCACC
jgi:hypothetical protein